MEEWRPIKDYEGLYEVSNMGRVRSLDRIIIDSKGRKHPFEGKIMKLQSDRYGYLYVSLNKNEAGSLDGDIDNALYNSSIVNVTLTSNGYPLTDTCFPFSAFFVIVICEIIPNWHVH